MRSPLPVLLAALAISLAAAATARPPVGDDARLRFNPFQRPELSPTGDGSGDYAARSETAWRPVLRATLVAGEGSLANLGGTVLQLGEAAHGYQLREVRSWEAVFEKGGATLVIPVESMEEAEGR